MVSRRSSLATHWLRRRRVPAAGRRRRRVAIEHHPGLGLLRRGLAFARHRLHEVADRMNLVVDRLVQLAVDAQCLGQGHRSNDDRPSAERAIVSGSSGAPAIVVEDGPPGWAAATTGRTRSEPTSRNVSRKRNSSTLLQGRCARCDGCGRCERFEVRRVPRVPGAEGAPGAPGSLSLVTGVGDPAAIATIRRCRRATAVPTSQDRSPGRGQDR